MVNAVNESNVDDFVQQLGEALKIHLACCKIKRKAGKMGENSDVKKFKCFVYTEK